MKDHICERAEAGDCDGKSEGGDACRHAIAHDNGWLCDYPCSKHAFGGKCKPIAITVSAPPQDTGMGCAE